MVCLSNFALQLFQPDSHPSLCPEYQEVGLSEARWSSILRPCNRAIKSNNRSLVWASCELFESLPLLLLLIVLLAVLLRVLLADDTRWELLRLALLVSESPPPPILLLLLINVSFLSSLGTPLSPLVSLWRPVSSDILIDDRHWTFCSTWNGVD